MGKFSNKKADDFSFDDEQDEMFFDKTDAKTVHHKHKMDKSSLMQVKLKTDRQRRIRREKLEKHRRLKSQIWEDETE